MISFVGALAVSGVLGLLGYWLFHRRDELGRPIGGPWISIGLLTALALTCGFVLWRHHQLESRLAVAASALAGGPVTVACQSIGGSFVDAGSELGYVKWAPDGVPERHTLLKRDVCNDLSDFLDSPNDPLTRDRVVAVHILSHESMHMAGEKAESIAECRAVQRDAWAARLLGASAMQASALARDYWRNYYPQQSPEYLSSDCAAGARWDERSPDAPWLAS